MQAFRLRVYSMVDSVMLLHFAGSDLLLEVLLLRLLLLLLRLHAKP